MKNIKNPLRLLALLLQVGVSFTTDAYDAQKILRRIEEESKKESNWEPTAPTSEDILVATKVENLIAKGSQEDRLINAVKNDDLESIETLISAGTGLEARDSEDMTALMIAAKKGFTDIASKLINAGAKVDAKDRYNRESIFYAIEEDHPETVKLLIANGAAKSQKDLGEIFVAAVFNGKNETVMALLAAVDNIGGDSLKDAYLFANKCSPETVNAIKELLRSSN